MALGVRYLKEKAAIYGGSVEIDEVSGVVTVWSMEGQVWRGNESTACISRQYKNESRSWFPATVKEIVEIISRGITDEDPSVITSFEEGL
jgi:hypothetical protein